MVLTVDDLAQALKNTLGKKGMSEEKTMKLAEYIMNFFGFEDHVLDNKLTPKDRNVFYMLEGEGLLTTTQEEISLKKGKLWRMHCDVKLRKRQI